ncbi:MAG: hypothetical protein ABI789_08360 [Usitatibacter sp.]
MGTALDVAPANGTFYAGVPATISVTGGHSPYLIASSEPGILPVPSRVEGSFEVVPNNPGVVDIGLAPGALPIRSVNVTVRDSLGAVVTIAIKVAQNFLTGYRLVFVTSTCAAAAGATSVTPCAGGDTAVQLAAVSNGSLHGNEAFRLEVVRGQFAFYTPDSSTSVISNSVTVTSDHEGKITAIIRVPSGVPPQIAIVRVVHIASGTSTEQVFTISGAVNTPLTLTAIPATFTFTAADSTSCGSGSGDFFVFDGVPPYMAVSSNSAVGVTPTSTGSQPGRFTITVANGAACPNAAPVIVTDSQGNRVTVTVTSLRGPTATPPPPLAVAPNSITLACGTSGSVSVVGGSGSYSVTSSHPQVNATVSGRTITITRVAPDPVGSTFPTTASISVTDGSTAQVVTATVPATCP